MAFTNGTSLHITVYIDPQDVDLFFIAFKEMYEKAIAEPECLLFQVYGTPQEPGTIRWVEDWSRSPEWFIENQITKDYYKIYLAITEPLFTKPRKIRFYERLNPEYLQ